MKEVRIDVDTGTATVIVPDFQLSLAIGKEGQNARLAARLTGWRVDIKSETQLADEEAYQGEEWAQGEWVVDAETGEQVWVPAEGGESISAEEWAAEPSDEEAGEETPADETPVADEAVADEPPAAEAAPEDDSPAPEDDSPPRGAPEDAPAVGATEGEEG